MGTLFAAPAVRPRRTRGQNMIDQTALLESQTLRSSVLDRTDVLDRERRCHCCRTGCM
ncbi:hypothetical protein ABZ372_06555 [Streptomyces sp. NPDC005921]